MGEKKVFPVYFVSRIYLMDLCGNIARGYKRRWWEMDVKVVAKIFFIFFIIAKHLTFEVSNFTGPRTIAPGISNGGVIAKQGWQIQTKIMYN